MGGLGTVIAVGAHRITAVSVLDWAPGPRHALSSARSSGVWRARDETEEWTVWTVRRVTVGTWRIGGRWIYEVGSDEHVALLKAYGRGRKE